MDRLPRWYIGYLGDSHLGDGQTEQPQAPGRRDPTCLRTGAAPPSEEGAWRGEGMVPTPTNHDTVAKLRKQK